MQFTFEEVVTAFLAILSYENQRIHFAEDKVIKNRLYKGVNEGLNELLNLVPETYEFYISSSSFCGMTSRYASHSK